MQSSPPHRIQVMTLLFLLLIRRLRFAAGRTEQQKTCSHIHYITEDS